MAGKPQSSGKPLWRQVFDRIDGQLAPRLEGFVQTSTFADGLSLTLKAQAAARRELERRTRQLWHTANLPAGSDVSRLREQVAALDRQVRLLTTALDAERRRDGPQPQPDKRHGPRPAAARQETPDARTANAFDAKAQDPARHGRPRAAGGRAQRAAGS